MLLNRKISLYSWVREVKSSKFFISFYYIVHTIMTSMHVKNISIISNKLSVNKDKNWTPLEPARWLRGYGACLQTWRPEFNSWNAWKDGRREMTLQSCPLVFTWTTWHLCIHAHPTVDRHTEQSQFYWNSSVKLAKTTCKIVFCTLMQHHRYFSDSDRATNCNFLSQS